MPKIKKPTQADISAMLSDVVAPKMYRNRMVVSKVAHPRQSNSEKKMAAIDQFRLANQYAKEILKEPGMKELYAKGIDDKKSNAHTVAMADFLNPPVIHHVKIKEYQGAQGDKLRMKVTDDFQVTSVDVCIMSSERNTLEQGEAVKYKRKPNTWIYTATMKNPERDGSIVIVRAKDRPGNEVEMELVIRD